MSLTLRRAAALAAAAGLSSLGSTALAGENIIGLVVLPGGGNALVEFDSDLIIPASTPVTITGLGAGEELIGIDIRPRTGTLYAVSTLSRLYTLDRVTGAATAIGSSFTPALNGTEIGFDFNPVADRIRIVTSTDQNLRLNPDTGAVAATDGTIRYAAGDVNAAANPRAVAAAYTNSQRCPLTTQLYVIDAGLDVLALQSPPNDGVLSTIGSLGIDAQADTSFDISGRTGIAYVTSTFQGIFPTLATVNLATGQATLSGPLDLGLIGIFTLKGIAAPGPCDADFNGDGFIDFFDYDAYVAAFEAGSATADLNCDRFIDFFDYDAFVASFEAGC